MGRRGGGLGGSRGGFGGGRSLGGGGRLSGGRSLGGGLGSPSRGGGLGGGNLGRSGGSFGRPNNAPRNMPRGNAGFGTGFGMGVGMGMGMGMGRRRRGFGWGMGPRWGWGGGWGRRHNTVVINNGGGMHGGGSRGGGCGGSLFATIALIILVAVVINLAFRPTANVTPSTINRTALPANQARNIPSQMFTDHYLGFIQNQTQFNSGLNNFHQRTGVRPHVYIIDNLNGNTSPSIAQVQTYADQLYSQLFEDEAHVLMLYFDNASTNTFEVAVTVGEQARSVIDVEAIDIMLDYFARYWHQARLTEEQLFSNTFNSASNRIMSVDRSPWIPVFIVAGIILLVVLLFAWWSKKKAQANLEAEQTERILNQSLDSFGSAPDAATDLAEKYENNEN